jgi:hypothetical protein
MYVLFLCHFNANLSVAQPYQPYLVTGVAVAYLITVSNFKELFRRSTIRSQPYCCVSSNTNSDLLAVLLALFRQYLIAVWVLRIL